MAKKLTIICPALIARQGMTTILPDLCRQADGKPVEVIALADNGQMTIGEKMNWLYKMASGEYTSGVGDDDNVSEDYVDTLLEAIGDTDVVMFDVDWGALRLGRPSCDFRPLCCVRTDLARRFAFPHWWQSEDRAFRKWLRAQGPTVKTLDKILYRYNYRQSKPEFGGTEYRPEGHIASAAEVADVLASQAG